MSAQVFTLPDLGEGLTEAELVRWLVADGDTVGVDQPVAEVETAKAVVEVPSPYAGTVLTRHGAEGETLRVGEPLVSVGDAEEAGSGNVLIGYGTSGGHEGARRRRRAAKRAPAPAPAAAPAASPEPEPAAASAVPAATSVAERAPGSAGRCSPRWCGGSPATTASTSRPSRDRPRRHGAAPRRGARRRPRGGGCRRRAVRCRVGRSRRAARRRSACSCTARSDDRHRTGPRPRTGLAVRGIVPLRGVRRAVAETLTRSRAEIPEATTWVDVDATDLLALRPQLTGADGRPVGLLAILARFVVAGLARFPELNARVDTQAGEIVHLDGVHLGIAAQTDRGLVVPSVADAHRLGMRGLDTEIRRLTAAARDGSVTAAELTRGSFTLNNYGVLGVDGSAAIINHPEVAMLGVGRVLPRPWVVDGAVVPRSITQLSLVFDHRVCDGGTAGGFLRFVADAVESPLSALADL
ncbi:dihydrolipoamide acetyltransferase family protein [Pseudonocardia alni]|uniref:dihydrolipoamide acetyltransferase family protein n=1 Tax=Pseudonocardia alni TaxID=33907 RepID=UPI0038676F32